MAERKDPLAGLRGGLIVSVQCDAGSPLGEPHIIAALAQVVAVPGVVGLRINSPEHVRAVRQAVDLPVLGIQKHYAPDGRVWITPTFADARALVEAGASIIAMDCTATPRAFGEAYAAIIARIHAELGVPVLADCSDLAEGLAAAAAGADLVGSTLAGYVRAPKAGPWDPPDLQLVRDLARQAGRPVIAEGRYNTPDLAAQAIAAGASAVVVGSAITRPHLIATSFVDGIRGQTAREGNS
jgi:N-acylglucosamine-6-phosphate 2-epimerase